MFGEITYTSDVFVGVAFRNAEAMREVLAVYAMDPLVQELNIMSKWNLRFDGEVPLMFYKEEGVSWHLGPKSWERVLMSVRETAHAFRKERGSDFDCACYLFRFGENYNDVEGPHCEGPVDLVSYLSEKVTINRSIEVDL